LLATQQLVPTHDTDVFGYAVAGVVLVVVGCVLSILATARRTARGGRPVDQRTLVTRAASASVARLQRDVRGWSARR